MLTISLWTLQTFATQPRALALLDFFVSSDGPLHADRFDLYEPVRKKLNQSSLDEAAELLTGNGKSGWIFLKNSRTGFLASLRWSTVRATEWFMQLDEKQFASSEKVNELITSLSMLVEAFPVVFGGAALDEEWKAKNWLIEESEHRTRAVRIGVDLERCLPGIYWITIFGDDLVEFFTHDKLSKVRCTRVVDLGHAGLIFQLGEKLGENAFDDRLTQDKAIIDLLGSEYFFDISQMDRACVPIPGVISVSAKMQEVLTSPPATDPQRVGTRKLVAVSLDRYETVTPPDKKMRQFQISPVISVEGVEYDDIEFLAADLVVYLHSEVPEIFSFSRAALASIDRYVEKHPLRAEFKPRFLMRQLLPVIGAYFGKVLVQELGGEWLIHTPIGMTSVSVKGLRIFPFRVAYDLAYRNVSLVAIFDSIANGQ